MFILKEILPMPLKNKKPSIFISKSAVLLYVVFLLFGVFSYWKLNRERSVWTAYGEHPGDNFGTKVAPAGDVNGDGYADLAIWSPGYGEQMGKVYIYSGSAKGLSKTPAWAVAGEQPKAQFGHSFGTVGNVNGDGFGDFIVGAQGFNSPKGKNAGKAYLYLGSPNGLSSTPVWTKTGEQAMELLGDCSGPAGDINKDGLADVVVGAYGYDHFRGRAFLYYGSKTRGLSDKPAWVTYGEDANDWYGYSVASCGDIKGDSYPGVVIGAKQHRKDAMERVGKVYVYYGSKDGLPTKPSWTAVGETEGELFGWRALPTGDIKGDGHNGLIISGYMYGNTKDHFVGKVYVYYGAKDGLPAEPSWTFQGENANSLFGYTIAAGDFTGSGYSDILVGAPYYNNERGKVYLFLGGPNGLSKEPAWTKEGEQERERFGSYVANVGDVNGDGIQDIAVGALNNSEMGKENGKVYLFYGHKNGMPSPTLP